MNEFWISLKCFFGFHSYINKSVKHVTYVKEGCEHPTRRTTTVLQVCEYCPKIQTEEIDEHWSLEELEIQKPPKKAGKLLSIK